MDDAAMREVRLVDAWRDAAAQAFFRDALPMHVHELSGFDTDFYRLGPDGKWLADVSRAGLEATPLDRRARRRTSRSSVRT